MREGAEEGGPVRMKQWTGKTGPEPASIHHLPFSPTPFQTSRIFFFPRWEKKRSPETHLCLAYKWGSSLFATQAPEPVIQ